MLCPGFRYDGDEHHSGAFFADFAADVGGYSSFFLCLCQTYHSRDLRNSLCPLPGPSSCRWWSHLLSSSRWEQQVRTNSSIGRLLTNRYFSGFPSSAFRSFARGVSKELCRQWDFACVQFSPLNTIPLTTAHSMRYMSFRIFHSRLHCFFPFRTSTSIHQRLPQQHTSGFTIALASGMYLSNHNNLATQTVRCLIYFLPGT